MKPCGRITVPGWMVRFTASEMLQPDRSTASVADGLYSSKNSALPPPVGVCWISLITMFGSVDCAAGTRESLRNAARRALSALNSAVRCFAYVHVVLPGAHL